MTTAIFVNTSRATIDPQGIGDDADIETYRTAILDALRAEWPGAEITETTQGIDCGSEDGHSITAAVRNVVREAFDAQA